jgi:hypothetical protein
MLDEDLILEAAEYLKDEKDLDLPVKAIAKIMVNWIEEKFLIENLDHLYYYEEDLKFALEKANDKLKAATECHLEIAA